MTLKLPHELIYEYKTLKELKTCVPKEPMHSKKRLGIGTRKEEQLQQLKMKKKFMFSRKEKQQKMLRQTMRVPT